MDILKLKVLNSLVAKILYLILLLPPVSTSLEDDQPYCALRYRRLCQGKGQHVACAYPTPGPGQSCRNYTKIVFTAELRHFVINYINKRRQRIAAGTERVRGGALIPKPQVMLMVVWDRELAFLAQRLADQCSFIHDDCRATVRYPYAGQTVGEVRWRGSSASDASSAQRAMRRVFDAWWGEKRRVRPEQLVTPFKLGAKGAAWGHFSQLAVWALAAAGCGAARHGAPRRMLLVCDFSHTNMLGQSTLIPGQLAPCPMHYVRRSRSAYSLLCAPIRKPESFQEKGDRNAENSYEEYATVLADYEDDLSPVTDKNTSRRTSWTTSKRRTTVSNRVEEENRRKIFNNVTKPHILQMMEQQLVTKDSIGPQLYTFHHQRFTTRFHFGNVRENHEKELMSKAKFKIHMEEPYYNAPEDISTEIVRKKWKKTRERPRRPGADALLSKPVEKMLRSSVPSLNLDRDDMEQLFQDTGFHKHWKKQYLP